MFKGDDILKAGHLNAQVNLMTRKDAIGIDFKITNPYLENKLGLHVIQTFIADSNFEQMNIQGIGSSNSIILSQENIQKHQQSLEKMKQFKQNKFQKISEEHKFSMLFRASVFEYSGQNLNGESLAELQYFLIRTNKLVKQKQDNTQSSNLDGEKLIIIMIENKGQLNSIFLKDIQDWIKEIFSQLKQKNKEQKFDQSRLRFKIYFLGSQDDQKLFESFVIREKKDLRKTLNLKENHGSIDFKNTLASALKDATKTEQQIDHLVLIYSHDINFEAILNQTLKKSLSYSQYKWNNGTFLKFQNNGTNPINISIETMLNDFKQCASNVFQSKNKKNNQ